MASKETSAWSNIFHDAQFPRICLSHVNCSDRKFRFICLLPDNEVEIPEHISKGTGIPLFLGCDVLSGCCQAPSNYARIHARYSKLGLATKLVLKDFRIDGLKKGSAFWFYNIEGLFRVIFECQDRKTQKSIITNLTNLWMERFNDQGLKDEYTVKIKKDSLLNSWINLSVSSHLAQSSNLVNQRMTTHEQNSVDQRETTHEQKSVDQWETTHEQNSVDQRDKNDETALIHERETTHDKNIEGEREKDEKTSIRKRETTHKLATQVNTDKALNTFERVGKEHSTCSITDRREGVVGERFAESAVKSKELVEIKCAFSKVDVGIQTENMDFGKQVVKVVWSNSNMKNSKKNNFVNTDQLPNDVVNLNSKTGTNVGSNDKCPKCSLSMLKENQNYGQCFNKLITDMKHFIDKFANCKTDSWHNIRTIVELLEYEYQSGRNATLKTGFPFEVIDLYLRDIQNQKNNSDIELKGTPTTRDIFLCTISRWLGKEYLKFQSLISDKVEKFKTDYITCIDDLPQSETIVSIIFPKCMQELLKSWIGCGEVLPESCQDLEDDHDYIPIYKKSKSSEENCNSSNGGTPFPLIQLILEFANKALVSGVAHVVYSKVCQAV